VRFYGVVDSALEEAVELFLRREDAERVVRDWDREEPEQGRRPRGLTQSPRSQVDGRRFLGP
jgi:hypothetical protein